MHTASPATSVIGHAITDQQSKIETTLYRQHPTKAQNAEQSQKMTISMTPMTTRAKLPASHYLVLS